MSRESFGALLAEQRQLREITTKALAKALRVSEQTIKNYEAGEREPDREMVFALENELGLEAGQLSRHLGYLPVDADNGVAPSLIEIATTTDELSGDRRAILVETLRTLLRLEHSEGRRGRK